MHRKLGLCTALLLVGLALWSAPASAVNAACRRNCFNQYRACNTACNGDPDCQVTCSDNYESCLCGGCGYCP
jgi:hypothetical protein